MLHKFATILKIPKSLVCDYVSCSSYLAVSALHIQVIFLDLKKTSVKYIWATNY